MRAAVHMIAFVLLNVLVAAPSAADSAVPAAATEPSTRPRSQSGSVGPAEAGPLAAVLTEADALLLAGTASFPDLDRRLAGLAPADRILAVAYLRRAGLLVGPMLPLDSLLASATGRVTHE